MPESPVLLDAEEMLHTAELRLTDIRFDCLSINLTDASSPVDGGEGGSSEETRLEIDCSLSTRHEGRMFGARFEFQIRAPQWAATIGAVTEYEGCQDLSLSQDAPADFASKVALMAVFPYVREALSDLTTRVTGSAVLLPLIGLGELTFSPGR